MKLCMDCKYAHDNYGYDCYHPNRGVNPVTGYGLSEMCSIARVDPSDCGPEGKWFEPKSTKPRTPHKWRVMLNNFLKWMIGK